MLKSVMRHHPSGSNGGGGLPTTRGNTSAGAGGGILRRIRNSIPFWRSHQKDDGSAASIRLQTPVVQQWQRSTTAMKISYIVCVSCLVLMLLGWRLLTYHAAHVHVNCSATECYVKLRIPGRQSLEFTISRSQLLAAKAVKTTHDGKRILQDDVNMNEEWKLFEKGRGKHQKNINTYKGPDKNGHYLSYALYIRNPTSSPNNNDTHTTTQAEFNLNGGEQEEEEPGEIVPERPLSNALVANGFAEPVVNGNANSADSGTSSTGMEYRITLRKYRVIQTRRRIRNMLQKVEMYTKRRRHKLVFKENAPPDWRGILMMVFGFIGFLLSILLGVFWDEEHYEYNNQYSSVGNGSNKGHYGSSSNKGHWGTGGGGSRSTTTSGPGARKKWPPPQALRPSEVYGATDKKKKPASSESDPYSRATPAQYEVSMQPNLPKSRSIKKTTSTSAPTAGAATPTNTTTTSSSSSSNTLTTRRRK